MDGMERHAQHVRREREDRHLEHLRQTLPSPDGDAVQRLTHTLAVFATAADEDLAIRATGGLYGDRTTGLTWGDLRQLLARLSG